MCALLVAPARRRAAGHDRSRRSPRGRRRRDLGGRRRRAQGLPRGARGDHDDHAQLDRDLHRRSTSSRSRGPLHRQLGRQRRLEEHQARALYPGMWGVVQQIHIGIFVALGARRRLLRGAQPHDARLRGARRRLQPRGGALRRHLRQALGDRVDGDLRARSPGLAGARAGARRQTTPSRRPTCPSSTSASRASRSPCSAATRPSAWCSRRSSSPRCRAAARSSRASFSPELASGVSDIIQGTIILLVGGELLVRWLVARARRERAAAAPTSTPSAVPPPLPRRRRGRAPL